MNLSFRDPSGFVCLINGDIYRAIKKEHSSLYEKLLDENWYCQLVDKKKVQNAIWMSDTFLDDKYLWLKHRKYEFLAHPHQISAEQLYTSALLTLEIAQKAFDNGWILKDASAWNVISTFGQQQFCDVTSFEPYSGESLWSAYGQFCRHFLIPLLLFKNLGQSPAELFISNRDGITPRKAKKLLGISAFTSLSAIEVIALPSLFSNKPVSFHPFIKNTNTELNKKIFQSTLNRLERYLKAMRPSKFLSQSTWSEYESQRQHYQKNDLNLKLHFVRNSLEKARGPVLDLGCNQGEYSLLAASLGFKVVASDFDENALIKLQSKLSDQSISVILLNIAQPTPSIGWNNSEYQSFLAQANNYFGIVLCLGLIHHLLISERIPLLKILSLLGGLTTEYILIEWINSDDPKFIEIASINMSHYEYLSEAFFEEAVSCEFEIANKLNLENTSRTLYLLKKLTS